MNRARKVARKWLQQRDQATYLANQRRIRRNAKRQPRPIRHPNKI